MSNYFSQFVPQLGSSAPSILLSSNSQDSIPQLKYVAVFNPTIGTGSKDEDNELYEQILCFITPNNVQTPERNEQLRVIGLIRGIDYFAQNFNFKNGGTSIIKSSKSSIVIFRLEADYYLTLCVQYPDSNRVDVINEQLIQLISRSHSYFTIFNRSLSLLNESFGIEILKSSLVEYYSGFIESYNSQYYKIPKITQLNLNWPNVMNYRGLLGLLPVPTQLYKKSSIRLGDTVRETIETLRKSTPQLHGIIVSNFGQSNPKKYGIVHMESEPKLKDSLVCIYNWLEMLDYNGRLGEVSQCKNSNFFSTTLKQPDFESGEEVAEGRFNTAIDFLNPINLTNNLVVSPLNYTMNTMMSIGGQMTSIGGQVTSMGGQMLSDRVRGVQTESVGSSVEPGQSVEDVTESGQSWLSVPPMIKNLFSTPEVPVAPEIDLSDEEEDLGKFLIGIDNGIISRKLVYLPDETGLGEYQLVIFARDDTCVTLVYESAFFELDNSDFYGRTQMQLNKLVDEVQSNASNALGASVGSLRSLRSLNNILQNQELDTDFFFVIYDPIEGSIQSSLPYLPRIDSQSLDIRELSKAETANLKYQNAMFYLHDQLLSLFIVQNNGNFFEEDGVNEYFHKFTSNRMNDWMFYYIRYNGKFIVIIKNGKRRMPVSVGANSEVANNAGAGGGTRIYGFLDNLGEDVKYWLEGFNHSGDT